ncbi:MULTISPECIES: restriction endonuclease subunit S [unclassified Mycoplasma]|uniref:restriction endonuclease subunit S n=1 Tax=unclassified Mycoplasma TaxID=2683645 RepID=UPI00211CE587|nr:MULTISPECIES: restriction endonuclease subunit S [unclassified Mycoplasma]UUM19745.1 restriction endonuclease subunit S [Mycoplasma sp. 1578d]UUM24729.1 restriction endonuclease subunit S [Mycoplasma sp. 3686d]
MLQVAQWGEYKLEDLFHIKSSKKIFHANAIKIYNKQIQDSLPYITRTEKNNGVRGFIKESPEYSNPENSISFGKDTFRVFYQNERFFTGNNINVLIAKFSQSKKNILRFITLCIQRAVDEFKWGKNFDLDDIKNVNILLPLKNNKIDFEFMESFIEKIETAKIIQLESYLTITGLKDYLLTEQENLSIERLLENKNVKPIEWKEFKISDLFSIKSSIGYDEGSLKFVDNSLKAFEFIARTKVNYGVKGYIEKQETEPNEKDVISIIQIGDIVAQIRKNEWYSSQNIFILKPRDKRLLTQFVVSAINKMLERYRGGYSSYPTLKTLIEDKICLPVQNNEIDFEFMENLVFALEKQIIKNVIDWKDLKIKYSKQAIEQK